MGAGGGDGQAARSLTGARGGPLAPPAAQISPGDFLAFPVLSQGVRKTQQSCE